MKSFCLFLGVVGLAWVSLPAFAQFHTIGAPSPRYRIQVVEPLQQKADSVTFPDSSDRSPEVFKQEKRIAHYLSVAYPLKSIKITSSFGHRSDPFTGKRQMHNGVDLHASQEEVYAMFGGVVVKTGYDGRSGIYITLRHGAYTVSYCHLSGVLVRSGDIIRAGNVVGITGNTGRSTGEHLHITCRYKGRVINPIVLIDYITEVLEVNLRELL